MAEVLESYYSHHSVYKAWIICSTDDEVRELVRGLEERDHSVNYITSDMLADERPLHMTAIRKFCEVSRILVISYDTWIVLQECLEVYVLPEIDLIAVQGLENGHITKVAEFVKDAARRGFLMSKDVPLLVLPEENL